MKRQGDLLIVNVSRLPPNAARRNDAVIAEGEKTGHRHELQNAIIYQIGSILYFYVPQASGATLTHPEHGPLVFPPGTYKVVRQKEYYPGRWRYVED